MTDDEWRYWSDRHATIFGLKWDEDLAMVGSWRPILDQYTGDELEAATVELAKSPPKFRETHISGLIRCLSGSRARLTAAYHSQNATVDDEPRDRRCKDCDGTGLVSVPHPACMVGGEFSVGPGGRKLAAMVFCRCNRGQRKCSTYSGVRTMTLDEYEFRVTASWRALMREWDEEKKTMDKIHRNAKALDSVEGALKSIGNIPAEKS